MHYTDHGDACVGFTVVHHCISLKHFIRLDNLKCLMHAKINLENTLKGREINITTLRNNNIVLVE